MEKTELIKLLNSCIDSGELRVVVFRNIGNIFKNIDENDKTDLTNELSEAFKDFDDNEKSQVRKAKDIIKRIFRDDSDFNEFRIYFETTMLFFLDQQDDGLKILKEDLNRPECRLDLTYEAIGFYLIAKKEYQSAIEAFDHAIVANSKRRLLCLWGKGNAYKELNDFYHAEIAYRQSMSGNTGCIARGISSLSRLFATAGDMNSAINNINENIDKFPFSADEKHSLLFTQIENYTDQEMFDEIKKTLDLIDKNTIFDKALKYKYDRIELRYLIDTRHFEEAEKFINDYESAPVINLRQRNKIRLLKVKLFALQNKVSESLKIVDKILESSESTITNDVIIAKVNLLIRDKRPESGLREIEKRISTIKGGEKERALEYLLLKKASLFTHLDQVDNAITLYCSLQDSKDATIKCAALSNLGTIEYDRKNVSSAVSYFKKLVEATVPQSEKARAYFELAKIYFNEKDYKDSKLYIDKAKSCDANLILQYKVGILEYHLNYIKNDFKAAMNILDKLEILDLNSLYKTNVVLKKAKLLAEKTDYDQAIQILKKQIELTSFMEDKSDLFFELGINYITTNDLTNGIISFEESINLSTDVKHISHCKFQKGVCLWKEKKFLDAFYMYYDVISEKQEPVDGATVLASIILFELAADFEVIKSLKQKLLTESEKENFFARILLAQLFTYEKKFSDADNLLKQCKFDRTRHIYVFLKYTEALNLTLMERFSDAKTALQEAENKLLSQGNDRFVKYTEILELLSQIEFKLKNYEKSKVYLEKAVKKGSKDFTSLFAIDEKISAELKENSSNLSPDLKEFISSKEKILDENFNPIIQQHIGNDKISFNVKAATKKGTTGFDNQIKALLRKSPEIACHYSTAETALFYILPSQYNHNKMTNDTIELRFTPLGKVNDIEEGEFYLDSEDERENVFALKKFNEFKAKIKRNIKIMCFSWSNEKIDNVDFPNAPFLIPPMWSHYSDTHSGVCLIFNLELLRKEVIQYCLKKEISIHKFQRVIYSYSQDLTKVENKVTSKELFALDSDLDIKKFLKRDEIIQDTKINTFFLKPPDWNYEREFRFMIHDDSDGYLHIKVPVHCITGVVIGKHLKMGFRSMLENVCKDHNWFLMSYDPRAANIEDRLKVIIS